MSIPKPDQAVQREPGAQDHEVDTNIALDAQVLMLDARQGELVLNAVYDFLGRFISYPNEHARVAHALWIVHTHMMESWDSTPRLAFLSAEPASGKTRALEITELLVPNPVATVHVSPAYLFRKIGSEEGATILYDEIDTVFGPRAKDNEDIRGLLNAGHRRGATTGRCVMRGNQACLEELPAYAAVALAGIGWLPDTILSRSVIIRMRRRHAGEKVEPFRRRIHENDGWRVRDMVAALAKSVSNAVSWPELPHQIVDRDADVWEPLIAVADLAGGEWPRRARQAGVLLIADAKEAEPSLGIRLLNDLQSAFGAAAEMSSKLLLQALYDIEESPWANLKGKPLDERGLAHRLRQYGVRSKSVRIGSSTPKGYVRADLMDVWARYLPPPVGSATSATSATPSQNEGAMLQSVTDRHKSPLKTSRQINVVADVAHVADFQRMERTCAHCGRDDGTLTVASVNGEPLSLHLDCKEEFWSAFMRNPRSRHP
jgi:hypothetical protein